MPKLRPGQLHPMLGQHAQQLRKRQAAQRQHNAHMLQQFQLALQPQRAALHLKWQRLIVRRGAARNRRQVCAAQRKPVATLAGVRLAGIPAAMQRACQKVGRTGAIAAITGEHAPGAVGAMRCRRKPHNQQVRLRIAKSRHGPPPILLAGKSRFAHTRHALAIRAQARATRTAHHLLLKLHQCGCSRRCAFTHAAATQATGGA